MDQGKNVSYSKKRCVHVHMLKEGKGIAFPFFPPPDF